MTTLTIDRPAAPTEAPATADTDVLVVVVRQEHIKAGQRGSGFWCPIARAVRDATGLYSVFMGGQVLQMENSFWQCAEATAFAYAFDRKQPVYPERFVFKRVRIS